MINPVLLALLTFLLSLVSLTVLYNGILILNAKIYLFVMLGLSVFYYFVRRTHTINRKADKLMILSLTLFLVGVLSSLVYYHWKLTNLISSLTITKVTLVTFVIGALYINFVYIRAEQSYKKKRGNQRIKEEPKQGFLEQLKEGFGKKKDDENEIFLTLGYSADNDDI